MKADSRTPPLREGQGGRRSHRRKSRNANLTTVNSSGPPPPALLNLAARNDPFSHIRVIPKPPVEVALEQRMQRTNSFTFKKVSFSEEADANLSSYSNPYNWQANLANASDGASFAQKARAAELNAARARKAAQMQSIDDEIPDLSGPVSLGMYKITRRVRSKKYENHRLSEPQDAVGKESENKVMVASSPISSPHPPFRPTPQSTFSFLQLSERPHHQIKNELNKKTLNRLQKPGPERLGFHEPGPHQYDSLDRSLSTTNLTGLVHFTGPDRLTTDSSKQSVQASDRVTASFQPAQDHASSQDSSQDSINPVTAHLEAIEQVYPSFSPDHHRSDLHFTVTTNPDRQSLQPGFAQAENSSRREGYNSKHSLAGVDTDQRSLQTSRQAHPSFPTSDRHLGSSQKYSELVNSLNSLIKLNGRSSKALGQASSLPPPQGLQPLASELYRTSESKADHLLETRGRHLKASSQARHLATPKEYASPHSLPLSDILPTASFNLETNQWDPDLPEAKMSAQTPTNRSIRGGHSGQPSSGKSSSQTSYSQDARNPTAIVTTTKSGRPYTNPYMPIHPPPSPAHQNLRGSSAGQLNRGSQSDDAEMIERQRKTRYIDQEESRYRPLEQPEQWHAKESLDDPFQDQTTHNPPYGRNQPSSYAEYAANQAMYGHLPGYYRQTIPTTYPSDPNALPFFADAEKAKQAPDTGRSPYRGQRSAYEQQSVINNRGQNPVMREQRSGYEQANPRASVRLPAVKGTSEQQKPFLQELNSGSLSLEDPISQSAQDPRRRQTQGGMQPVSGRISHAVPIRDPAAYTGSGLTSRRNQEALRHNLDTVVATSQGSTGAARTVMNDPHREHQVSSGPSPTATDTTVTGFTGSTLRAQAPSYESGNTQRFEVINPSIINPRPATIQRQGKTALGEMEPLPLQVRTSYTLDRFERAAGPEVSYHHQDYQSPAVPAGLDFAATEFTKNAGLPAAAIGAGNVFMNELVARTPPKRSNQQRLEDSKAWFRHDTRDLSYAAAILPYETMNKMNADKFPIEDRACRTVGQLADDSQDDDPSDRAREAATPRPIGHGRPAGFATPPSAHGPRRGAAPPAPFSTLAGVSSASDKEAMERSGREFLRNDAQAIEAMFGGVYANLMSGKNGPYDYMNHYCPPPAYAIDHNARNNDTLFDPQWFATAPPARVGRDPRREQGEYEDPTQGIGGRRSDHTRGEALRRDSGGRGGGGVRAWGRN